VEIAAGISDGSAPALYRTFLIDRAASPTCALSESDRPEILRALSRVAGDKGEPDVSVRLTAIVGLATLSGVTAADRSARDAQLTAMFGDSSEPVAVRAAAARAAGQLRVRAAEPGLLKIISGRGNAAERDLVRAACVSLCIFGEEKDIEPLAAVLADTDDAEIHSAAAFALGMMESDDAVAPLLRNRGRFEGPACDLALRKHSDALLSILSQPKHPLLAEAVGGAGCIRDRGKAVGALLALIDNGSDPRIVQAALDELYLITDKPALRKALDRAPEADLYRDEIRRISGRVYGVELEEGSVMIPTEPGGGAAPAALPQPAASKETVLSPGAPLPLDIAGVKELRKSAELWSTDTWYRDWYDWDAQGNPISLGHNSSYDEDCKFFNNDWGSGTIAYSKSDHIMCYGYRTIYFPSSQNYKFTLGSDDGSALYLDSNQVINNWIDHSYNEQSYTGYVEAGYHDLQINYYDQSGGARLTFTIFTGNKIGQELGDAIYDSLSLGPLPDYYHAGVFAGYGTTTCDPNGTPQQIVIQAQQDCQHDRQRDALDQQGDINGK